MLVDAGVPFALSSDAHLPEEVGYAYDRAVKFLAEIGVTEIAAFEGRVRRMEPLG
jgi:histidinol-phosphatase (PHP family)